MGLNFGDRKFFLLLQRYGIRLLGFWPGSDDVKSWQIALSIVAACEVLLFTIFQLWFCAVNIGDLVEFLRGVTPAITQILTALEILSIVWKRKQIKQILDHLRNAFSDGNFISFRGKYYSYQFCYQKQMKTSRKFMLK